MSLVYCLKKLVPGLAVVVASIPVPASAGIAPTKLQCESRVNPLGIDEQSPQLSWRLIDTTPGERGQRQTAFRIQVATSQVQLSSGHGDLWDSGRVLSGETAQVAYQGKRLASGEACFWRVKVWDRSGKPSPWSTPARWSVGLLSPSDWKASWISDPLLAASVNWPLTPIHCFRSLLTSTPNATKWVTLDLGRLQTVDGVTLFPARPADENKDFRTAMFPVRFKIEASADPTFSQAVTVADQRGADFPSSRENACRFSCLPTQARYVRLTVTTLARWDGDEYGVALGGMVAQDGKQSLQATGVECSDSTESSQWSKRYFLDLKPTTLLAGDSPAIATGMEGVAAKSQVSRVPMLRRDFNLAGEVKRATLYATARGFYEMRLNGQRVSRDLLAPGFTDYNKRLQVQTYDVTGLLRTGKNAVGALLGYGWYAGHMNLFENRCFYGYFPQLLAQLDIEMADGRHITIGTDTQWHSSLDGPVRWSDLLDGEGFDGRRAVNGWDKSGFDDRKWQAAWSQPLDNTPLVWQRAQPVRKILTLKPVSVKAVGNGTYVLDFGQEITGWCRLDVTGAAGTRLKLRHAELLDKDGNLDVKNLWGTPQEEDYILGGGSQVLEPHFTYHGFRYVELSGFTGKLTSSTLEAVNIRTDAVVTGHFECSNPLFNRIQQSDFWTQSNLLFDVPAGCAARSERLAWTGDIRPCVPSLMFNFDAESLLTKYAQDLRDDQKTDGRFTDICPHAHLDGTDICVGSPGWADAGASLPWEVYVATGNKQILAEHFEAAKRWVDFIHAHNPDLIWRNNRGMDWGDWLSAGPATPKELGATAFFAHSADLVSQMAQALDRPNEAQEYAKLFQGIRRAFVKEFVQKDGAIDKTTAQGSYALALQFGLLDEPLKVQAKSRLCDLVEKNGYHPTTGFWSSIELLLSLPASQSAQVMSQTAEPSWGYMAEHGTTMWEAFNADSHNLSLNHWTHSASSEWLWRTVAGLNPDPQAPGFKRVIIRPRLIGEVTWCHASYDSIRGQIISRWKRIGNRLNLDVTVPANTTATVYVPGSNVTEGGKQISGANGVKFLRKESGEAVYQVESGTYHFRSQISL